MPARGIKKLRALKRNGKAVNAVRGAPCCCGGSCGGQTCCGEFGSPCGVVEARGGVAGLSVSILLVGTARYFHRIIRFGRLEEEVSRSWGSLNFSRVYPARPDIAGWPCRGSLDPAGSFPPPIVIPDDGDERAFFRVRATYDMRAGDPLAEPPTTPFDVLVDGLRDVRPVRPLGDTVWTVRAAAPRRDPDTQELTDLVGSVPFRGEQYFPGTRLAGCGCWSGEAGQVEVHHVEEFDDPNDIFYGTRYEFDVSYTVLVRHNYGGCNS